MLLVFQAAPKLPVCYTGLGQQIALGWTGMSGFQASCSWHLLLERRATRGPSVTSFPKLPSLVAGASAAPEAPEQPPAAKEGAKASPGEERAPPPPDTRTWLQKNWIFMVPVVMIVRLRYAVRGKCVHAGEGA